MIDTKPGKMSLKNNHFHDNDTELEDDLELLRLAALKSLQPKRASHSKPIGNAIEVLGCSSGGNSKALQKSSRSYGSDTFLKSKSGSEIYKTNPLITSHIGGMYSSAKSSTLSHQLSSVQLSPRSAAFVLQNNSILMRRQQGMSRSPSPQSPYPRNKSTGRWSTTPPPASQSKRNGICSPVGGWTRRSDSLSRSPLPLGMRHRSRSRSPLPPLSPSLPRRSGYASRSPSPTPFGRRHSRSRTPPPFGTGNVGGRRAAPPQRRPSVHRYPAPTMKTSGQRTQSPTPAAGNNMRNRDPQASEVRVSVKRSSSPRRSPAHNGRNVVASRRRTKSPLPLAPKKRTTSRSPVKKLARRSSRDRALGPARKRSPLNAGARRTNSGRHNVHRNSDKDRRHGGRRSVSPPRQRRSKSKNKHVGETKEDKAKATASSSRKRRDDRSRADVDTKRKDASENSRRADEKENRRKDDDVAGSKKSSPTKEDKKIMPKTDVETTEENLLKSSEDEMSGSEDEIEIDLFASEESESETEGRFKSSKNQRTSAVPTMSFSKLGSSSAATIVRDLNDVSTAADKMGNNSRRDRDNRNTGSGHRRNNDSGRRGGSGKDSRSKKSTGSNRRAETGRENDRDRNDNKSDKEKKSDEKSGSLKMFRSTFQAIDSDLKQNEKMSEKLDEPDKRSASASAQLKRSKASKDDHKGSSTPTSSPPPRAQQTSQLGSIASSIVMQSTVSVADASSARRTTTTPPPPPPSKSMESTDSAGKKPIHLRLGAMTKTWKSTKKTWTSEKV